MMMMINVISAAVGGCDCCSAASFPFRICWCCGTQYLPTASASISLTTSSWQCCCISRMPVSHRRSLCNHKSISSCLPASGISPLSTGSHPTETLAWRWQYLVPRKWNDDLELFESFAIFPDLIGILCTVADTESLTVWYWRIMKGQFLYYQVNCFSEPPRNLPFLLIIS